MNGSEVREALHNGRRVYGTCITSAAPLWPRVVTQIGIDFVFICTEHFPIPRDTLSWMCQTYKALNLAPIVRIPEPDPYQAEMVLGDGASGIIAPYVETPEQVQALRGAVKLRPLKGKRRYDFLSGRAELELELSRYLEDYNAENVLVVNIESVPAVEALDEILSVPQLDAVLVGPHDLSTSLGVPEQYDDPEFNRTIRTIIRKAREHNVGAGVHFWAEVDRQLGWAADGANLIMHGTDMTKFANAMRDDFTALRKALGDERSQPKGRDLIV
jgi:4-hydroxy-2-oxoheptanedioate aldolase